MNPPLSIPAAPWVAIVANPFSGARSNRSLVERLAAALRGRGLESRLVWDPAQRDELLRHPRITEHCRCVIAAGGDGTFAGVVNLRRDLPAALFPLGNENLLARQFQYPSDPEAFAARIAAGKVEPLDLGRAGERYFALMASVGFDAEVVRRVAAWRNGASSGSARKRVRRISYAQPSLAALTGYRFPIVHLEADGVTHRGALAMVFNLPRYALNLPFAPEARGDDGLLDWVLFTKPGRLRALDYLISVALGRHTRRRDVLHSRAAAVTIHSDAPAPVQLDGDAAGFTPVTVRVEPAAARVVR